MSPHPAASLPPAWRRGSLASAALAVGALLLAGCGDTKPTAAQQSPATVSGTGTGTASGTAEQATTAPGGPATASDAPQPASDGGANPCDLVPLDLVTPVIGAPAQPVSPQVMGTTQICSWQDPAGGLPAKSVTVSFSEGRETYNTIGMAASPAPESGYGDEAMSIGDSQNFELIFRHGEHVVAVLTLTADPANARAIASALAGKV